MSAPWLIGYLEGTGLRAGLLAILVLAFIRLVSGQASVTWRAVPLALTTLFVVVLAFHPGAVTLTQLLLAATVYGS